MSKPIKSKKSQIEEVGRGLSFGQGDTKGSSFKKHLSPSRLRCNTCARTSFSASIAASAIER